MTKEVPDVDVAAEEAAAALIVGQDGEETTSTTKAKTAADEDTDTEAVDKASDEAEPDAEAEAEAEGDEEKQTAKARGKALQRIIDTKYGGDEEAFVEGLYEQWNSASGLKKELEAMKKEAAKPSLPSLTPEALEQLLAKDPEINAISEKVNKVEAKRSNVISRQGNILKDVSAAQMEMAKLEGRAEKADEYDKSILDAKRYQLELKVNALAREYQELDDKLGNLDESKSDLQGQLKRAKRDAEAAIRQYQEDAVETAKLNATLVDTFTKTALKLAVEHGVPEKNWDYMMDIVKSKGAMHIRSVQANDPRYQGFADSKELEDFISKQVKSYAENHSFSRAKDLTDASKAKLAKSSKPAVPVGTKMTPAMQIAATIKEPKKWTAEFVKLRAAKILGG